jgi:RNA polymerase nonessential primary-like sigma factor
MACVTMRNGSALRARAEQMLERAHDCMSRALQLDYLSRGAVHYKGALPARELLYPQGAGIAARSAGQRDILGRYLYEIATRRRLSSGEEYQLASAARAGDAHARQKLIEHQLRLVVLLARRYCDKGLPQLDLIEEGNIGLLIAIEKFDPEMGHRFSTYAKWWIRQSIELALMTQPRVVHVPVHVTRALKRQLKKPADSQASAVLKDSSKFLLYEAAGGAHAAQRSELSDGESIIDKVPAPEHDQPDWPVQLASQRDALLAALALLNPNEQIVIEGRFGLRDDEVRTLESLAEQLKLSSERVRQIQGEALRKLRALLEQDPA